MLKMLKTQPPALREKTKVEQTCLMNAWNTLYSVKYSCVLCIYSLMVLLGGSLRWFPIPVSDASQCLPLHPVHLRLPVFNPASGSLDTTHGPGPQPARWADYQNQTHQRVQARPHRGSQREPHARCSPRIWVPFPRPGGQLPVPGSAFDSAPPYG